jgi:D-galactarolactone cycloisomerase
MIVEQADIYVVKVEKHYRVGGHEDAPGRLPGTDYYFEPQWRQAYSRITESCLLKLTTSNGIAGWGEAQAPLLPETPASILARLLAPMVIGTPALASEAAYERLYHAMLVRGHNASYQLDAIGAIDTALWDIRGQKWNASICELLGGPLRERLPAYLSGLRRPTREQRIDAAKQAVSDGMAGVKLFIGQPTTQSLDELRAVRTAIGSDGMLAVDCIHGADWDGALRIGQALDELNGTFLEAPLAMEDLEGHRELGARIRTRLAGGENFRSVQQYLPWLQSRVLRIAQPDVVRSGITAARRIASLAQAFHLPAALHVGVCTGVGMAATWQVAASLPNFLVQEHQYDLFETANQFLSTALTTQQGHLVVPTSAGLGIRVSEEAVLRHAVEHWTVTADGPRLNSRSSD